MIDAHNHLQKFDDPDAVIVEMKAVGIQGCIVNGTREEDWPEVAALAERHPDFVRPAFGLHPWFADQASPEWLGRLVAYLDRFPTASIGECGVDGWVENPSLDVQLPAFLRQLRLARERDLPITVHSLKAWGPLLEALKAEPPPARGFLLHSYGGSRELIAQLAPLGARFSFSGYFLHPRKAAVLEAYRHVPPDRLLLESDAPEMTPPEEFQSHPLPENRNHPANLAAIASGLAQALSNDFDTLNARLARNTLDLFE